MAQLSDEQKAIRSAAVVGPQLRSYPAKFEIRSAGEGKVRIEGYASTTEQPYTMYDWLGEYKEVVDRNAFARTLGQSPDVVFLVNHEGLAMARTTAGNLELSADDTGLRSAVTLNEKRSDVQNLIAGIEDGVITEMSFAFGIDDFRWSPDYEEFRILEINLNRGDVSAVNFGANPSTSIGVARSLRSMSAVKLARAAHSLRDGSADASTLALAARVLDGFALEREPNLSKMTADIVPDVMPADQGYLRALTIAKEMQAERARMNELFGI